MITLIGNKEKDAFKKIQDRLDSLSLSYQLQYTNDSPYLQDGKIVIKGEEDISSYIDELASELNQWYYCAC